MYSFVSIKPISGIDTAENSWSQMAPMNVSRSALGAIAVNDTIYAIGGSISTRYPLDTFVAANEEYDVATNTWLTKASMPTPRGYFAIAAYQNKIYCIGGAVGMAPVDTRSLSTHYMTSNVNEVYDTLTGTWTTRSPLPEAGMQISAQQVNGKIYVVGLARIYVYDVASDSWTNKTSMPLPASGSAVASAVCDNKIVVTRKYFVGNNLHADMQTWIYDTTENSWSQNSSAPTVVGLGGAQATSGIAAPRRVYVLGLTTEQYPPCSANEVFDPETGVWGTAAPTPTNRSEFSVVMVNDRLYVIGGFLYSPRSLTLTNLNEEYTPIGYGYPDSQYLLKTPPKIMLQLNKTYSDSTVPLIFSLDKRASWVGYSLDGQQNVTIRGNTTLTGLSNGYHNVTVYVNDTCGNMVASETVNFTVASVLWPFSFVLVSVGAVLAVAACVGVFLYFRRKKPAT
jgi:N-acetylneuraminic acid mutarotase